MRLVIAASLDPCADRKAGITGVAAVPRVSVSPLLRVIPSV